MVGRADGTLVISALKGKKTLTLVLFHLYIKKQRPRIVLKNSWLWSQLTHAFVFHINHIPRFSLFSINNDGLMISRWWRNTDDESDHFSILSNCEDNSRHLSERNHHSLFLLFFFWIIFYFWVIFDCLGLLI